MKKTNNNKIKIKSTMAISLLVGIIGFNTYSLIRTNSVPKHNAIILTKKEAEYSEEDAKEFQRGEHIIIKEIRVERRNVTQVEYHEGYRLTGITTDSIGTFAIYVNEEEVSAIPTGVDNNNEYIYGDFGLTEFSSKREEETNDTIDYNPGEHILLVPISKPRSDTQVMYHEGYTVEDIASYTFGRSKFYGGGYILYTNTEPVRCRITNENRKCLEFGTPIEKSKIKSMR